VPLVTVKSAAEAVMPRIPDVMYSRAPRRYILLVAVTVSKRATSHPVELEFIRQV
jgi:hypothetical protein